MKLFSSLKQKAVNFLEPYKTKGPATYAAAEQAIGAILITDGFFGIESPYGKNKRPGIFGTIGGVVCAIVFMFVPTFFGDVSGINDMTAITSAKVVSVGMSSFTKNTNGNNSTSCTLIVNYSVDGQEYTKQSSMSSSNYCSLSAGQVININYNPANPGSWVYGAKMIGSFLKIFFWVGLFILFSSVITFFIRLFSIIFGWKLLKDGRKNAANLPAETNLQTMVEEIKKNFMASIFGFGSVQSGLVPGVSPTQIPGNPNQV
ncbi:MAG TPA: hypothetical protein PLV72_00370 [Candidatus Magasanikbacteria bacterium]|nr:hypothetical protein [Candidatus Magasanikbacteria bacterium]